MTASAPGRRWGSSSVAHTVPALAQQCFQPCAARSGLGAGLSITFHARLASITSRRDEAHRTNERHRGDDRCRRGRGRHVGELPSHFRGGGRGLSSGLVRTTGAPHHWRAGSNERRYRVHMPLTLTFRLLVSTITLSLLHTVRPARSGKHCSRSRTVRYGRSGSIASRTRTSSCTTRSPHCRYMRVRHIG